MIALRDYQQRGCANILRAFEDHGRIVAVAPTGSGKTYCAAYIIQERVRQGQKCLFLAHRKELIDQTSTALDTIGVAHGVIMANHWRDRPEAPVQVASIDSLMAMRACRSCKAKPDLIMTCNLCNHTGIERSRQLPEAHFVVCDEGHRSMSSQYQSLISFYPRAKVLLITATPWRLDGKGLGSIVKKMVVLADMRELIAQKHLLPIRLFRGPRPDMSGVKIQHGDYRADDAAAAMRKTEITGNVVEHYIEHGNPERGVAFTCNVPHSIDLSTRFNERGVPAEHIDGSMSKTKRAEILARLKSGETRVVTNCDLLVEGWDLPSLHCVMLVRPTKSITRYLQQVGRCMRPFPGQEYCLVLDHAGCRWEHGRPDDFREWSLEDRRVTGRPQTKIVSEPEACPVCGLDLVRKICARCSPQMFSVMFTETDDRLVEDRPEEQTALPLHEPDRTAKKRDRASRPKHGMIRCSRCKETWVAVPSGKTVRVTCHKCLAQENRP